MDDNQSTQPQQPFSPESSTAPQPPVGQRPDITPQPAVEPVSAPGPQPAATLQPQSQPMPATDPMPPQTPVAAPGTYVSNPFLVGIRSIIAGLKNNPVAIMLTPLMIIAAYLVAVVFALVFMATRTAGGTIAAILVMSAAYLFFLPVILGMYYTVAARSDKDQAITTKEAFSAALGKALPTLGLIIVLAAATLVGLLLLIIPGVIFIVRASLALTVMYFEGLGVFASIKRSFELTKGHFMETLGAIIAGGFLGANGLVAPYFGIAQMVGRYNDYKMLQESSAAKPKVHWLNYVPLVILIIFGGLYGLLIVTFANVQNRAKENLRQSQQLQQQNLNNDYYNSPYQYNSGSGSNYDYDFN